ncbi:hypothetical protein HNQ75_004369 [Rhizobium flavum]|uniref:Uncharacterized protein n=1 Tax=Pseudorhizobium flavum TaxID=1335061 RepID=A0A7W9Z1N4_9HYPH|nr:hypothetical protein [Pseudorhizobium flavum]
MDTTNVQPYWLIQQRQGGASSRIIPATTTLAIVGGQDQSSLLPHPLQPREGRDPQNRNGLNY